MLGAQESKHDAKLIAVELDADLNDVIQLSKMNGQHSKKRLHYLVKSAGGIGNIDPYSINIDKSCIDFGNCEKLTFKQLRGG